MASQPVATTSSEPEIAAALVRRVAEEDREAEAEVVDRYARGLRFTLMRLTRDHALREDLEQETMQLVLIKLRNREIQKPESLGSFIAMIARNLFLEHKRKQKRHGELAFQPDQDAHDVGTDDPSEAYLDAERNQMVRQLVGEMKHDRDRQILFKYYIEQQDSVSICSDLGIESRIFKQTLHRARQRFKELWDRHIRHQNHHLHRQTYGGS